MNRKEWMRHEIAVWRTEGLVDEPTAARLTARYQAEERRFSWGTLIASGFGALFIGLGLIAIFAANWDNLGRGARAALAISPVVACGLLALTGSVKKWTSMLFWEPLGIAWMVAAVAGTSLVAQTYQIGGTVPALILFLAALTYPIAWATRAVVPMGVWPVFGVVWACCKCSLYGAHAFNLVFFGGLGLVLLSVPALVAFLKREQGRGARTTGLLLTGLVYTVGCGVMGCACFEPRVDAAEWFVLFFWGFCALVAVAAWGFKLPVWRSLALVVAALAAVPTAGFDHQPALFAMGLALAIAILAFGVRQLRLSLTNLGATLLLWLVLFKFFESRIDFTVKGLVLILCGVGLTVFNVVFVRLRKRGKVS